MSHFSLIVNGEQVYEYHQDQDLDDKQRAFLDKMDNDMSRGIKIKGELIQNPNVQQRLRFVVLNLLKSIKQENDAAMNVSCAYLLNRMPQLSEVHARDEDDGIRIDFIEG